MTDWQKRFSQKLELARSASSEQFEVVADQTLVPAFETFQKFTAQQGVAASAPLVNLGARTFKFALAENAYLLMTFRLSGLDYCELYGEFVIPGRGKLPPVHQHIELAEVNGAWARRAFEESLDHFVDALVGAMSDASKPASAMAAATA